MSKKFRFGFEFPERNLYIRDHRKRVNKRGLGSTALGHGLELLRKLALLACGAVSMNDAMNSCTIDALDKHAVCFLSSCTITGCDSGVKLLGSSLEHGAFGLVAQRLCLSDLYTLFSGFDIRQISIPSFPGNKE